MRLSKTEIKIVRNALNYSIRWNQEFLAALGNSKSLSDVETSALTKKHIRACRRILNRIQAPASITPRRRFKARRARKRLNMKRLVTTHHVPGDAPQNQLSIAVLDAPGSGGANHHYLIFGGNPIAVLDAPGSGSANHHYLIFGGNPDEAGPPVKVEIRFQNGPIKEKGVTGLTNEVLLAVVADRLQGFQSGPYACADNAEALNNIMTAMTCLQRRTVDRIARGVEGTLQK